MGLGKRVVPAAPPIPQAEHVRGEVYRAPDGKMFTAPTVDLLLPIGEALEIDAELFFQGTY